MDFKTKTPLLTRKDESHRIRVKYPDRIPVIVEKHRSGINQIQDIDKNKYLVPDTITIAQFLFIIRKRIHLPHEKALFFFINGTIPTSSSLITALYDTHKDEDGFLYIQYASENTFGQASCRQIANLTGKKRKRQLINPCVRITSFVMYGTFNVVCY